MTATLELRPYQQDAIARTIAAEAEGERALLGVAATGLGKTVMFTQLARQLGGRTLVLAHRDELIAQAARSVLSWWPEADVGVVKAERDEVRAQVVVASVQTLARPNRLASLVDATTGEGGLFGGAGPFRLVVVDEAHHAAADTYQAVVRALGAGEPEGPLLLGVTATPDRGDGKGLDDVFSSMPWSYDLLWGIRAGYLSDVVGRRVHLDGLNLADVKVSRGDYQAGDAGRALEDAGAPEAIVAAWQQLAHDRARTLVFTPTVDTAQATAAAFNAAGIPAGMVSGTTPTDERRELLGRYHRGDLGVLVNCMVLTEGYDEPATDCIVMARPTKSRALYTQCVGRGTRLYPGKRDCLVLDVVGASDDHSLVTIPSLFGLDDPNTREWGDRAEGRPITEVLDERDQWLVSVGRLRAEDAELFKRMRAGSSIAWVQAHKPGDAALYVRSLGKVPDPLDPSQDIAATVVLQQHRAGDEDAWSAWVHMARREAKVLTRQTGAEHAQGVADDYCRRFSGGLTSATARWRQRPPSPKQRKLAAKMGLEVGDDDTMGSVSDRLDAVFSKRVVHRLPMSVLEPEPDEVLAP